MEIEPPLQVCYYALMKKHGEESENGRILEDERQLVVEEYDELPLIDLGLLKLGNLERESCKRQIVEAAKNWGFFQVVNHGVPERALKAMMCEQKKLFNQPFEKKSLRNFLNLNGSAYRWGNSQAMYSSQIQWSEAFRIAVLEVSSWEEQYLSLRSTVEAVVKEFGVLAESIAEMLGQSLGIKLSYFQESCESGRSSFRLNRYPPCPFASKVYGLLPHTDSDYLTILYQTAQINALQLMKDGKWLAVKPNPQALLVNIGDLLQVVSNDVFKSLKHKVVASEAERFSFAYLYCPSDDVMIESCLKPSIYRRFSYKEYRQQIEEDVGKTGNKVGLSRFLLHNIMLPHLAQSMD